MIFFQDTPKLIVPEYKDSRSSSSSAVSDGMEPMSNAWIEEETAPYLLTPQVSTAEFLNEYTTRICSPAAL